MIESRKPKLYLTTTRSDYEFNRITTWTDSWRVHLDTVHEMQPVAAGLSTLAIRKQIFCCLELPYLGQSFRGWKYGSIKSPLVRHLLAANSFLRGVKATNPAGSKGR